MLKRFIEYYKPHKKMLTLDMLAALLISLVGMVYPIVTNKMLNIYIPNKMYTSIVVAGIVVLLLYLTLLFRSGRIASRCEDPYSAFLVIGISTIITVQALMHMFISVSDFVTGQPLPLVSQGGTAILINCVYIGIILCVSREAKRLEREKQKEEASINQ